METKAHQGLKRLAIAHLKAIGCAAFATEVKCPLSRFRVDAAGYRDISWPAGNASGGNRARRGASSPFTVVIECKQCRADFLRDREMIEPLLERRDELERMRLSIEEHRIRRIEPHLRRDGSSLFAQLDEWDFHGSRLPGYRSVMRQLRRVDEKLHGETKFFLMAKYRLADQLYLAAPKGMIRPREVPPGWGLLECAEVGDGWIDEAAHESERSSAGREYGAHHARARDGELRDNEARDGGARDAGAIDGGAGPPCPAVSLAGEEARSHGDAAPIVGVQLMVRVEAPLHVARPERRVRMLRNIAVAASRHV